MTLAFASCLIPFEEKDFSVFISSSSDKISITSCRCSRYRSILNFHRNYLLTAFLFFIGAIVVVQLIKNSHYIWTQNKRMLYAHTRDHNASTNADYTNEVADWDWACETITHNPERLVITCRSADEVLVLQDIARISSYNLLKIVARLAKHSQSKVPLCSQIEFLST
jgi:hypothetical protein